MSKWIRAVNRVLDVAGVEIRRLAPGHHSDPFEEQRKLLRGRSVKTIFDVGANVGLTARRYAELFPHAAIHCFEPFPESHRALSAAFPEPHRVQAHAMGISDSCGERTLFVNKESVTNSLLRTAEVYQECYARSDKASPTGSISVPTTTLDAFCDGKDIDHIDVLKLDVQGGELLALLGAARMLGTQAIDVVYSEVNFSPIYDGQAFFHDLAPVLLGHGYSLYNLFPLTHTRNGIVSWSDAIWINNATEKLLS